MMDYRKIIAEAGVMPRSDTNNEPVDGDAYDEVLRQIPPPADMLVAYKVVGYLHAEHLTTREMIKTVRYKNVADTVRLISSNGVVRSTVDYFPGETTVPSYRPSRLFAFSDLKSAKLFLLGGGFLYRCFVPWYAVEYPVLRIPARSSNIHIEEYWEEGALKVDAWPVELRNVVLATSITLMDRLA